MEESLKSQALAKMLDEMSKDHTPVEDYIHNWLCGQEDEELFAGVLKDGKSINGAVKYMANQARKGISGNMAVTDDATGFGWVRDYFTGEDIDEVENLNFSVQSDVVVNPAQAPKPKYKKKKPIGGDDDGQLSLFEDLMV